MAGCCGNKGAPGVEYEITFTDTGEKRTVGTMAEVRIIQSQRKNPKTVMVKAVPKSRK